MARGGIEQGRGRDSTYHVVLTRWLVLDVEGVFRHDKEAVQHGVARRRHRAMVRQGRLPRLGHCVIWGVGGGGKEEG